MCSKHHFSSGLPQIHNVTVADQCVSDFTLNWTSTDFDPTCGNISYVVNLIEIPSNNSSPDEPHKRKFNMTSKSMNFTGLNSDTEYIVTIQSILMERMGAAVNKCMHTVNVTSARPSSKSFNTFIEM